MTDAEIRIAAVDWSGKSKKASEAIWLAEAVNGQIAYLENGLSPNALIAELNSIATRHPRVIVGFDFAFSMPAWYVQHIGATTAPDFWKVVAANGETWLKNCPSPFFGLVGKSRSSGTQLRATEETAQGAKSVFQINGPGAVGVGSIRGMPLLLQLQSAGWSIWPFDQPRLPMVVEIYPRLLIGKVHKTVWKKRLEYLERRFTNLDPRYMERAAGSEDAFDAAVSALVMEKHRAALLKLPGPESETERLEGRIWRP